MSAAREESFEKALERLERIAARLEAGDVPLEKGVALYKEGMGLVASCRKRLEAAKLELSLAGEDGVLQVRPHAATGSHRLRAAAEANALITLPEQAQRLDAGAVVEVLTY